MPNEIAPKQEGRSIVLVRARFLQWLLLRSEAVSRWCEQKLGLAQPEPYKLVTVHLPGGTIRDYSNRLEPDEGWSYEGDPLAGIAEDHEGVNRAHV